MALDEHDIGGLVSYDTRAVLALVEPIRTVRNLKGRSGFEEGDPYTFIECVRTIFPITAAHGRRSGRSTGSRA